MTDEKWIRQNNHRAPTYNNFLILNPLTSRTSLVNEPSLLCLLRNKKHGKSFSQQTAAESQPCCFDISPPTAITRACMTAAQRCNRTFPVCKHAKTGAKVSPRRCYLHLHPKPNSFCESRTLLILPRFGCARFCQREAEVRPATAVHVWRRVSARRLCGCQGDETQTPSSPRLTYRQRYLRWHHLYDLHSVCMCRQH